MYAVLSMNGIEPGYPRSIREEWPDLPDDLDAALYLDPIVEQDTDASEPAYLYFFKVTHFIDLFVVFVYI